jgi:hypothetical protein
MGGRVLAAVVGSFLLLVTFFRCWLLQLSWLFW